MGTKLIVDAINLLKQTGVPIDVVVIPGNHDFSKSYYLGSFVEAWFNNDPMVNVNNGASPRKYYNFGKVLLGLTHGNEEKESSLPLLMATDITSKPLWSETTYHEWHIGHQHRKKNIKYSVSDNKDRILNEDLGVTVRYLSSLTGTEQWHHKKAFIGQIKAAEGFIWNNLTGMIAHLNTNIIID
jgi:DNA repair exonuclease SbcCD nuclease subunit